MWAAPSRELSVSPPLSQLPDRGCTVTSHPMLLPPHGLSTLELSQNKPVVRSDFCWAFCHSNNSQGPQPVGFLCPLPEKGLHWAAPHLSSDLTAAPSLPLQEKVQTLPLESLLHWGLFRTCGSVTTIAVVGRDSSGIVLCSLMRVGDNWGWLISPTVLLLCRSCNSEDAAGS